MDRRRAGRVAGRTGEEPCGRGGGGRNEGQPGGLGTSARPGTTGMLAPRSAGRHSGIRRRITVIPSPAAFYSVQIYRASRMGFLWQWHARTTPVVHICYPVCRRGEKCKETHRLWSQRGLARKACRVSHMYARWLSFVLLSCEPNANLPAIISMCVRT